MTAALYLGRTEHFRFAPRPHRFAYRMAYLVIDIDRVSEAPGTLRLFRIGRFGLFSFSPRDHGDRRSESLRPWVLETLAKAGVTASAGRIRLLSLPRLFGFVFNPLSVFFIETTEGRLEAVIYEVNNTFGQTHAYVVPASGEGPQRQVAEKLFYVSPFYKVEGAYRFRVTAPGRAFALSIVKTVDDAPDFTASLHAVRTALTDAALLRLSLSMPFMTLGVVAAIHWEALRLWLKGAPFGHRPPGPKTGVSSGRLSRAEARRRTVA